LARKILIIDDEDDIREVAALSLESVAGWEVVLAGSGAQGLVCAQEQKPDAILLDVMMPKIDGVSLVPMIRRITEAPILMLSALTDAQDKISGLTAGADDYVAKPFDLGEVAARLRAQLRRPQLVKRDILRYADVVIDIASRRVETASGPVELTAREFDLLATFLREPGRVFTRDQLLDRVWGRDAAVEPNVVETYVSYLRNKLGEQGPRPLIRTIRRVGYTARVD
jgi:two-component system response regulator PrrA